MKSSSLISLVLAAATAIFPLAAISGQPANQPGIQIVRPDDLGRQPVQPPTNQTGTVRQRVEYGKDYRYGRQVNGPRGNITIMSPNTADTYGAQPRPKFGPRSQPRPRPHPPTGPRLEYKPDYGSDPSSRGD